MNIILLIIGLTVIVGILLMMMFILYLRRRIRKAVRKTLLKAWEVAMRELHPTMKVVEADKILDEALTQLGFTGTLGEKLQKAGPRFSNLDGVWRAHKLRNRLVHDLQKKPSDKEVEDAMQQFRLALRDLGV